MLVHARKAAVLAASSSFVFIVASGLPANAAPKPEAPDAVTEVVKNGSYAKIGPWLANLYEEYREAAGRGVGPKAFRSKNRALRVSKGMVGIDAYASNARALAASLRELGALQVKTRGPLVSASVPVRALGDVAALGSLRFAQPVMATTNALPPPPVFSQGDVSLNSDDARAAHGVDGSGLTVGTISDSMNCNPAAFQVGAPTTTYEQDIGNDDLPTETTILDNGACPGSDEGRAMSQIVHDIAPGASIAFHTAFNSEFDFAEGIIELADNGADVSVDDVIYFAEPMFMDGMIAQAVDIVAARGVPHYSSAGNDARHSYENAFRGINVLLNAGKNLNGGKAVVRRFHNFGTAQQPAILQPVRLTPDAEAGFTIFSFQWDQPHIRATTYARLKAGQDPALAVGAASDLDIVIFDNKGHVVPLCPPGVARGITCQITGAPNIGGDAVDVAALFYSGPPKVTQRFFIGFVLNAGPDPGVVKYVWFDAQGVFGVDAFHTQSGTAYGHSNAAGVQAIGAASWYVTEPFSTSGDVPPNDTQTPAIDLSPCEPACLNDFSSAGGVPIYFDRFGNRLAAPQVRRVPSVTGPDGGNSTFFLSDSSYDDDDGDGINSPFSTFISGLDLPGDEYPNFFGTSASAPHVAGVAALMLEKSPGLTVAEIRATLEETARPITLRFTSARPTVTFPITETGPGAYDFDSGWGLVDALAALDALED
jgi:subtilisin family serine protease